jgi:hypothetical protein
MERLIHDFWRAIVTVTAIPADVFLQLLPFLVFG